MATGDKDMTKNFIKGTLANELRYVIGREPHGADPTFLAELTVNVGARDDGEELAGIGHFIEHVVFRGSSNFPSCTALENARRAIGGYTNASTSVKDTVFTITGRNHNLELGLSTLADMVFRPLIADDLESERGVILAEFASDADDSGLYVHDVLFEFLLPNRAVKPTILGSRDSISSIGVEALRRHHDIYYRPQNAVISVVSTQSFAASLAALERSFGMVQGNLTGKELPVPQPSASRRAIAPGFYLQCIQTSDAVAHVCIAFLLSENPLDPMKVYRDVLMNVLFDGAFGSALHGAVRQAGIAYSVLGEVCKVDDSEVFMIEAGIPEEKMTDFAAVLETALSNLLKGQGLGNLSLSRDRVAYNYESEQSSNVFSKVEREVQRLVTGSSRPPLADKVRIAEMTTEENVIDALKAILAAPRVAVMIDGAKPGRHRNAFKGALSRLLTHPKVSKSATVKPARPRQKTV